MDLKRPQKLILPYTQAMMAPLLFHDNPQRVLLLGLGGGSMVRFLRHHQPSSYLWVIEKEMECVQIAQDFFHIEPAEQLKVTVADARLAITACDQAQDLLFVDVFVAEGLPDWVGEESFFQDCHDALNDTGIVVANLWVADEDEFFAVIAGIRDVFSRRTLVLTVEGYRNLVVLAFKSEPRHTNLPTLYARARCLRARTGIDFPKLLDTLRQANPVHKNALVI